MCLSSSQPPSSDQPASSHALTRFPSIVTILADRGCRHLFLLARTEAPALRLAALKAIAVLFEVARGSLKLQRELFLSFLVARLEPVEPIFDGKPGTGGKQSLGIETPTGGARPSTPALGTPRTPGLGTPKAGAVAGNVESELREVMMETLVLMSREPSFMVDLWANYDCDVNCEDIFEHLVRFLAKVCKRLAFHTMCTDGKRGLLWYGIIVSLRIR
jgi:brefeldin A-resistance guanine nucleotide exchange factor 1